MPAVYLGRILVSWCMKCNLPILERSQCPMCGSDTEEVPLTPPGDAYPAVGRSIDTLRATVDAAYGQGVGAKFLPEDKLILLNSIPFEDRAIEVVLDGRILGRTFYDPSSRNWTFKPTIQGAARLAQLSERKRILADGGAVEPILRGGSLLAAGILGADESIQPGDEVSVMDPEGRVFSVGSARMSGREMLECRRGMAAKMREAALLPQQNVLPGGQSWDDAVRANEGTLKRREEGAINFVRQVSLSYELPKSVAFSGGKDSLCTLLVVAKAIRDFKVLFIDTGIEFPETIQYTDRILESMGLKDRLVSKSVGERFWQAMRIFGPPARDARWCCKVCKLGPTTSVIQEVFGGACLTFVGQRKYESQQRFGRGRISHNPWVPGQVAASPIRSWTALHVWLYAMREKAEMNPLYYSGYARIGCMVCPSGEMAEFHLLGRTHPEVARRFLSDMEAHGRRSEMPDGWLRLGLWRWRNVPPWASGMTKKLEDPFTCTEQVVFQESRTGLGTVLNGTLGECDRLRAANALNALGGVEDRDGRISTSHSRIPIELSADGRIVVGPCQDGDLLWEVGRKVAYCMVKARYCVGCGTCVGSCHRNAIEIVDGRSWIGGKCTHCASCTKLCPLLTWAVREPVNPFG